MNSDDSRSTLPVGDRLMVSICAGWILYSAVAAPGVSEDLVVVGLYGLTAACVCGRLIRYCHSHWPPISLWGRIWTGRWIIPGYDRVFVAPLVTALIGIVGLSLNFLVQFEASSSAPAAGLLLTMILGTTLVAGPDRRRWQLTCPCRIGCSLKSGTFERL